MLAQADHARDYYLLPGGEALKDARAVRHLLLRLSRWESGAPEVARSCRPTAVPWPWPTSSSRQEMEPLNVSHALGSPLL
jgi:hypothetical protein